MAETERSAYRPDPLVIVRDFAAPRETVFRAWSTAEHVKRWFSPEGLTVPEAEVDFRPGGVFAVTMRTPDGQDFRSSGHYIEIDPPSRLVFAAQIANGTKPGFAVRTTVLFEDHRGGTRLTVRQEYEIYDDAYRNAVEGAREGWRTTLDKLEREVARIRTEAGGPNVVHGSFTIERTYGAAPSKVFHALTDPAAKAQWFASADGLEVLERQTDIRPGGRERVKGRWQNGTVSTFDAVYYDLVPDRRLIYAYEMHIDGAKISVSLATLQLSPAGAGTRLTVTEHGAFLDGYDDAGSREKGTAFLLEGLAAAIDG